MPTKKAPTTPPAAPSKSPVKADGTVNKSQAIRDMLTKHPEAKARGIVDLLAKQGIQVRDNKVFAIKGELAQKLAQQTKKAPSAAKPSLPNGTATPEPKVNRSQAIRVAMKKHPQAKPKEIVEILAKEGVRIKQNLVYMVKGQLAQKKSQKRQQAARVAKASEKTGMGNPVALILKVKELANEAGGMNNLQTLVGLLTN